MQHGTATPIELSWLVRYTSLLFPAVQLHHTPAFVKSIRNTDQGARGYEPPASPAGETLAVNTPRVGSIWSSQPSREVLFVYGTLHPELPVSRMLPPKGITCVALVKLPTVALQQVVALGSSLCLLPHDLGGGSDGTDRGGDAAQAPCVRREFKCAVPHVSATDMSVVDACLKEALAEERAAWSRLFPRDEALEGSCVGQDATMLQVGVKGGPLQGYTGVVVVTFAHLPAHSAGAGAAVVGTRTAFLLEALHDLAANTIVPGWTVGMAVKAPLAMPPRGGLDARRAAVAVSWALLSERVLAE